MRHRPASFDSQAAAYDQRAGFSPEVSHAIAQAAVAIGQMRPRDLIVEIGAGTGQIGRWFAQSPWRYIGFDLSRGMLEVFQQHPVSDTASRLLVSADGTLSWPLADATASLIFSSRALHLLPLTHVVTESFRIARHSDSVLITGRVQRQQTSVTARMQREMQQRMRHHGFPAREGNRHHQRLCDALCQRGARMLEPVVAARWTVKRTPWQSIEAWQSKPGLGGADPPREVKDAILRELQEWAKATFANLHQPIASEETYVLQGIELSGRSGR